MKGMQMTKLRIFLLLLLAACAPAAFSQGYRFDSQISTDLLTTAIPGTGNVLVLPTSAQVAFCNFPANAVPCTNKATTYTSATLGTPCSTSTQITLTGSTTCVASPDVQQNWGVWVPSGQYSYTVTMGGVNFGPYVVNFGIPAGAAISPGTINGPTIGNFYSLTGTLWWDGVKYPYTTAGLQQVLADCLASTTCEQVHLEGAGAQTVPISSTTSFGSTTKSLTVYYSRSWNPNCTMTNDTDCFVIHADTSFVGNGVSVPNTNSAATQGMTAASNASVSAMVRIIDLDGPGTNNAGGLLDGLTIIPNANMKVSDAIVSVQNPVQVHAIRGLNVGGGAIPTGSILMKIFATPGRIATNVSLHDVQLDGGGTGRPLWIGCTSVGSTTLGSCSGIGSITIDGGATVIVHSQTNQPEIDIEGGNGSGGQNAVGNIGIFGIQGESRSTGEIGILCNGCANLLVDGYSVSSNTNNGADVIKLAQPAGTTVDGIDLYHIAATNAWTNIVNNTVNGDKMVYAYQCSNGCTYHHHKNFANVTATEVWADGTGRIMTKGVNGLAVRSLTANGGVTPGTAGGADVGSTSLPFGNLWLGTAATNNNKLTSTTTAARVTTFPDANITVSGATGQDCGTTSTCAATNISATLKIVKGSAPLVSGTPSTVTISGISPAFTSSSSYVCTVTDATTATNNLLKVANVSGSSFTITGPNTLTDVINYVCAGN